ncbi:MAG: ArsC family transcriptional regulator [Henriciella sp.]|nr:ArsC family transcriptional regulator [Henriciella sp.]
MSLTLYGLKNCDTCKKALKALEVAGKVVSFVDIRAEADLSALLPRWLEAAGEDVLINRRSTTWRNLSDEDRMRDPLALLSEHPTLIKRPVIEAGEEVYVGWAKTTEQVLL